MKYDHPELRERLAAEYALGTLRGAARRRFERVLAADRALRDLVQDWELRLNLLAESAPVVTPPARVWERIERRLGPAPLPAGLLSRWWNSLGFWRGAGLLATAAAAALALYIGFGPVAESQPRYVAVLIDQEQKPILVAELSVESGRLAIQAVRFPTVESGKDLELWMLPPGGGVPRSLGLIRSMETLVKLTERDANDLAQGGLAISLEQRGGSLTGRPTGPVLFSGGIVPVNL